ncbi:MAG: formate-dependent phosphoribosylglycinamide formyltransferase [Actinomyces sp.]|uniref:formate-dependent phosphoribosylglycinamide formyltransferase n=1 Tax=Pauljensenia sp. UMB10120 TaxID=3046356 RepID=UPI0025512749|nr:formate-dependent phosphoribosylglycinamide formyltransferase [Pauljensenia sp. UMB10120]MDK6242112.1 formate-dependent phosphoribosylglycinamide formyltransferase [Pauljensenia sp. UMB10120]MDU7729930.1 formate-dependent phosphoribosylglycinamide formyltransferase [Actinomyces sp.]
MTESTSPLPTPLPARVLLLGSGELGRELTISLKRLGAHVTAVDAYAHAPAMQVADDYRVIDMSDPDSLRDVLSSVHVDLIVPELEAIATHVLAEFEQAGSARVVPNAFAVQATMDRERIRSVASAVPGVRTSKFRFASSVDEVRSALEYTGVPAFIKPTMSSSGHGQSRVESVDEAESAWTYAQDDARATTGRVIVEEGVTFDCEITLLTVRWWDDEAGEVRTSVCEPIGHRQVSGDYVESWQSADISPRARERAEEMAVAVTGALAERGAEPCLGLFGVEFFIQGDDVWFSELSPRPHDTGMVTMMTQDQSEFDIHARAILGLPVDTTMRRTGASAVVKAPRAFSLAGYEGVARALRDGGDLRIFSKSATRAGRRLAVALAWGDSVPEARERAQAIASEVTVVERDDSAQNTDEDGILVS